MIIVNDNVLPVEQLMQIRQSALNAGFNTWTPPSSEFGSGKYENMGFQGEHAPLVNVVTKVMGKPIYPNSMFFRVTNENTEKRYIHSDLHAGAFTALIYLSDHEEVSGTAFYKNKEFNLTEMPTVDEMDKLGIKDALGAQMISGEDKDWLQEDFVKGKFGRCLIFNAPLFHARIPDHGIGTTPEDGRMVWASHFYA